MLHKIGIMSLDRELLLSATLVRKLLDCCTIIDYSFYIYTCHLIVQLQRLHIQISRLKNAFVIEVSFFNETFDFSIFSSGARVIVVAGQEELLVSNSLPLPLQLL